MTRNNDAALLHPDFRARDAKLLELVRAAGLPIEPYEGWRDPNRQAFLYTEGRVAGVGTPGHHVTFERPWESNHQGGFARDWVWWINNAWSWAAPPGHSWDEFHQLALRAGLQFLNFEEPHVQLPGISMKDITERRAPWPAGGDDTWEQNIEAAIVAWGSTGKAVGGLWMPGAPPLVSARPPLIPAQPAAGPAI